MTDIIVKIIEDDPSQYAEGVSSQEQILKDCGMSLPEIKAYMAENLPPPPTPPEESWPAGCDGKRRRTIREERSDISFVKEEEPRFTINCGKRTLGQRRNVVRMIASLAWVKKEATAGDKG